MSKIKILPEILSNKIAAGEVVERPSSVVKELVENSLDANSSRIIIEVEKGGSSLIRVSDNGTGMNRDDALLAMERYATSKIYKDKDLFSINTLGFRGEALPSIASVSRFTLITRDETPDKANHKTTGAGTEIVVEGGKITKVFETGAPKGTLVTVKNLFFNMPARRKFLKTINTEMSHVADVVASIAVGRPKVQFKLFHNKKVFKTWSCATDPVDRVADVLGKDIKNDLHAIEFFDDHVSVAGWISSPEITRSTSRGIYVYVNGRFVRDRVIQYALFEGYKGRLMKERFPVAVLFITVPFDQVDVNVHPRKQEVRFVQQQRVNKAVTDAVSQALHLMDRPKWGRVKSFEDQKACVSESVSHYSQYCPINKEIPLQEEKKSSDNNRYVQVKQTALWDKKRFGDLRVVGQFHGTYILCESDEGLVMIDQHAAHERVLFEYLKNLPKDSNKAIQKLLIPETIDLGYREANMLEKLIPDLKELGLEIESFGGNTFVIKAVPAILADKEISPLINDIVEKMVEVGFVQGLENAIDQCLILMACHGAIRANQNLADEQIRALLDQLDECANPSYCPHGRPTWIRWTISSLEKSFSRIV